MDAQQIALLTQARANIDAALALVGPAEVPIYSIPDAYPERFITGQATKDDAGFVVTRWLGNDALSTPITYDPSTYTGVPLGFGFGQANVKPSACVHKSGKAVGMILTNNRAQWTAVQGGGIHQQFGYQWSRDKAARPWAGGRSLTLSTFVKVPTVSTGGGMPLEVGSFMYVLDTKNSIVWCYCLLLWGNTPRGNETLISDGVSNIVSLRIAAGTRYCTQVKGTTIISGAFGDWRQLALKITPANLINAIDDLNSKRVGLVKYSRDPEDYALTMCGFGDEAILQKQAQTVLLGCGFADFTITSTR